jgi:hypothetical protein
LPRPIRRRRDRQHIPQQHRIAPALDRRQEQQSLDYRAVARVAETCGVGGGLLTTTRWQRLWSLARPFLIVLGFAAVWQTGLWWLTPLVMLLLFIAIVTVTHDVVHGALGLSPRQSEWWLFLLGVLLLESGHA